MKQTPCEICGGLDWTTAYAGLIRDGDYLNVVPGKAMQCTFCGVVRLDSAMKLKDYEDGTYLEKYPTADKSIQLRDEVELAPYSEMAGTVVLDLGAGGMEFCVRAKRYAAEVIAVEPNPSVEIPGVNIYPSVADIPDKYKGEVGFIACFSVLEHVEDPIEFLRPLTDLLRPRGALMLSVPNGNDIMLEMLPDIYPRFFYRTAHKWYFDEQSLEHCLGLVGLYSIRTFYMQRFGFNNLLGWMRDGCPPKGETIIDTPAPLVERLDWDWATYCEATSRSDYMFNLSRKIETMEIN